MVGMKRHSQKSDTGISIANGFGLFLLVSYCILAMALIGIVYGQLKASNNEAHMRFVEERVRTLKIEFQGFIHSYHRALSEHAQFSMIQQGVMQPAQMKEILRDFFSQLHLQGESTQQVLVDFEGKLIHRRDPLPAFDYQAAEDISRLLKGEADRDFSINFDEATNQYFWRVSVPVKLNGQTEGALIAEVPFFRISDYLKLRERLNDERINLKQNNKVVASIGETLQGIITFDYWENLGLSVEYIADVNEQLRQEHKILALLIGVLLLALLLSAGVSFYLGKKYFIRPMVELSEHVSALANGDISELPKVETKIQEVNDLARVSTYMSQQVSKRTKIVEYAYEQLRDNQSRLVQSEKMASLGFLSAGVAHEINNPAGFVKSNLEVLKDYTSTIQTACIPYFLFQSLYEQKFFDASQVPAELIEQLKEQIETVKPDDLEYVLTDLAPLIDESLDGMQRIESIVESMKKFARPDSAEMIQVDVNDELKNAVRLVWNELKYACEVEFELGELPSILCYPGKLNQVFLNLLVNASQAIKEKGIITISTELKDQIVEIRVTDDGEGMSEDVASRIFEPFFTTKASTKGTGLGLSISSDIIAQHNGVLRVESKLGEGSSFIIELPVSPNA